MDRNRLSGHPAGRIVDLSTDHAPRRSQRDCHQLTTHHSFALAVAGLAAFAAVACLPAPTPGTASRATGFPTGDPPRAGHTETTDDSPALAPDIDFNFDFDDWCYEPLNSAMH